jgi:hypothetical protein
MTFVLSIIFSIFAILAMVKQLNCACLAPGTFRNLSGFDVNANLAVLNSFAVVSAQSCQSACQMEPSCALVVFKPDKTCKLYSSPALNQVKTTSNDTWLFQKFTSGYKILKFVRIKKNFEIKMQLKVVSNSERSAT